MAECSLGQNWVGSSNVSRESDEDRTCQHLPKVNQDDRCAESEHEASTHLDGTSKHADRQNGIVTQFLRPLDDADNGESGDSGHGSSCQDCECASVLSQLVVDAEKTSRSQAQSAPVVDSLSLDESCADVQTDGQSVQLSDTNPEDIDYVVYESELQMPDIIRLITKDLSEPYSIYTYRYFIHNWPKLCLLAMDKDQYVGAIVCKLDMHKKMVRRGYIAMLAVDQHYRRKKIGSTLVTKAIRAMMEDDCDEVVLETEITNKAALRLYQNLGFIRDKRLFRYYLNGVDALRLKLWLR